jgi:hypothetical protein
MLLSTPRFYCGVTSRSCVQDVSLGMAVSSRRAFSAATAPLAATFSQNSSASLRKPLKLTSKRTVDSSRNATTMARPTEAYEAVVIGGGPAGITVVGNLLEQKVEPILWVDDSFDGGRINRCYREVPSNTKVALFIDYATAVAPFRKIVSNTPSRSRWEEPSESDGVAVSGKPDKLQTLRSLDPAKSCQLSHAADMLLMLTEGLSRTPGIIARKMHVTDAMLDEAAQKWTVNLANPKAPSASDKTQVVTNRLIMCTGSSPNNAPLPVDIPGLYNLDLDCALQPTLLATTLSALGPTSIAVIGASHSAILVLMNLYEFARTSKSDLKITWLTRHKLRYAEQRDGWILRDNTGLKGSAAEWARNNLEPDTMPNSDVSKYVSKVAYKSGAEKETYEQHLQGKDFYVQAIGYSRDPIPALNTSEGRAIEPVFDHENGHFEYAGKNGGGEGKLQKLPGLFGAGIAWPARVVDPEGNVEYAVGFFKFMKHIKKVVGTWI